MRVTDTPDSLVKRMRVADVCSGRARSFVPGEGYLTAKWLSGWSFMNEERIKKRTRETYSPRRRLQPILIRHRQVYR